MEHLIILDAELNRLFDVDTDDVISPLVIEDSTTGENTFEFSFPIEDPDYVVEGGQVVLIKDEDGDWQPYLIKKVVLSVVGNGEQILRVSCDHLFYELADCLPQNHSYVNFTPAQALASALADTRWQVGTIEASITDLVTISGSFYNPLRIVRQIETELEARVKFRATVGTTSITGLYVDIEEIDVEFSGQRFEFGYNLSGIDITVDSSRVYTALTGIVPGQLTDPVTEEAVPLTFADEVWTIAGGDPADKPATQTWVGNEAARLLYGIYNPDTGEMDHRFGIYDSGAATTSEGLLDATWLIGTRYHFAPKVNIEASVADLSKVKMVNVITGLCETFDNDKVRVGNICYVIAENHGLLAAVDVRIIRIERYLKEPTRTRVIFGDALLAGSDFLRELQDEVDSKTRRRAQAPDRGPGAAVTIASADTSLFPEYADIIVPTGSPNFEQYFEQAIDDLPAEGGQILILEGEYVYSDTMTIDMDNVTVTGQGEGTVIKLADTRLAETYGFYTDSVSGTKIQDLVLDGNKDNQTEDAYGIDLENELLHIGGYAWWDTSLGWWTDSGGRPWNGTMGWEFEPNQTLEIESVRVRMPVTRTYTVKIWDVDTQLALVTTTVSANPTTHTTKMLDTPLEITPGKKYRISFNYLSGETYAWRPSSNYAPPPIPDRVVSLDEFDDDLTVTYMAYYAETANAYPATTLSSIFLGFVDFGIAEKQGSGNTRWALKNVTVKDYTSHGIVVQGGYEGEVSNCRATDNTDQGLHFGEVLGPNSNVRVLGCDFRRNQVGIIVFSGSNFLIQNNVLLENDELGMLIVSCEDCSIIGNTCEQTASTGDLALAGIAIFGCDNNTIGGNVSVGNTYWGISLEGSDHNVVSNNVCNDSVNADGIYVAESSLYNTIQGNKCTGNAAYGIRIIAGSNYNQVTNNDLYGNTSGGLLDGGTGTVTTAGNRST